MKQQKKEPSLHDGMAGRTVGFRTTGTAITEAVGEKNPENDTVQK